MRGDGWRRVGTKEGGRKGSVRGCMIVGLQPG